MLPIASSVRVRTREILDADRPAVARLLTEGFRRSTVENWFEIFDRLAVHQTPAGLPKYGYLIESEGVPVGAILIISSTVRNDNVSSIRCNLSSWYVSPSYRSFAHLFMSRVLKRNEITFVNVSAAPHTFPIIQAQGFSRYSNGQFFAITLPLVSRGDTQVKVLPAGEISDGRFDAFERELLHTHAQYGCMSICCTTRDQSYPFVFRLRVLKGILPCAQLIYCRNIEEFVRFSGPIGRFLARRGRPLMMVDANGAIPGLVGIYIDGMLPRYYKGPMPPRLGDLAYTESALFGI